MEIAAPWIYCQDEDIGLIFLLESEKAKIAMWERRRSRTLVFRMRANARPARRAG
jgi:hypothetical protein